MTHHYDEGALCPSSRQIVPDLSTVGAGGARCPHCDRTVRVVACRFFPHTAAEGERGAHHGQQAYEAWSNGRGWLQLLRWEELPRETKELWRQAAAAALLDRETEST